MLIRTFGNKIVELRREDFLTDELYYKEIMYVKGLLKKKIPTVILQTSITRMNLF